MLKIMNQKCDKMVKLPLSCPSFIGMESKLGGTHQEKVNGPNVRFFARFILFNMTLREPWTALLDKQEMTMSQLLEIQ